MKDTHYRILLIIGFLAGLVLLYQAIHLYQNPSIIIEWSTASELEVAGFNILRADNPDGPFAQINDALVPSSGDSGTVVVHGPIEAKAQRGGIAEAALAAALLVGSALLFFREQKK